MSTWAYRQSKKPWQGSVGVVLTVGIHAGVVAVLLADKAPVTTMPAPISVAVISDMQQAKEQPLELTKPRLDQPKFHVPQPEVTLADTSESNTAPVAVVNQAPSSNAPAPAAPAVVQPIFDADYLNNPQPAYPPLSRRMREQGVVYLRVLVSAEGVPDQVELKQSSGSVRLDESALCAVKKWRFVPARRGSQIVAAWVVVPVSFSLTA